MARRRQFSIFSLSFLDVMSCGFGAIVLFFMIISHRTEVHAETVNKELLSEVRLLEQEVLDGEEDLAELRNTLAETDREAVLTEGLSRRVVQSLREREIELARLEKETLARKEHVDRLKADIRTTEEETRRLADETAEREEQGEDLRTFMGEGDRQYLTGLKLGGKRILILVDSSASMLDETIVNVIRRRNMQRETKLNARKWQRAVSTVDWLTAQIPVGSQFQIYSYNVTPTALIAGSANRWLSAEDGGQLDEAMQRLRETEPADGTSLQNALAVVNRLKPAPDNIYLLVDGLPTQGEERGRRSTVSGKDRMKHFERAIKELPSGIPVNVILFPMEGDPAAAGAYWQLALDSGGSFLSPSKDWP
ncbi:MAG TPA: VWA domain-containing protein [Gammaproteobacteria bacterium]|nr:VWA domain-containing protein [Gammaproteobacteria bacterium]